VLKDILARATPEELKKVEQWHHNISGTGVLFINDNAKARGVGNKTQNIFEKPLMLYRFLVESWSDKQSTVEEWGFGSGVLPRFLLTPEGDDMCRGYVGWEKDDAQYNFVLKACKELEKKQKENRNRPVVQGDDGVSGEAE